MVGVAQLVEHLIVVQDVAGSSPVTHPIFVVKYCSITTYDKTMRVLKLMVLSFDVLKT